MYDMQFVKTEEMLAVSMNKFKIGLITCTAVRGLDGSPAEPELSCQSLPLMLMVLSEGHASWQCASALLVLLGFASLQLLVDCFLHHALVLAGDADSALLAALSDVKAPHAAFLLGIGGRGGLHGACRGARVAERACSLRRFAGGGSANRKSLTVFSTMLLQACSTDGTSCLCGLQAKLSVSQGAKTRSGKGTVCYQDTFDMAFSQKTERSTQVR